VVINVLGEAVDTAAPRWRMFRNQGKTGGRIPLPVFRLDRPSVDGKHGKFHDDKQAAAVGRRSMLGASVAHAMKLYLAHLVTRRTPRSVRSVLSAFAHFERYCHETLHFARGRRQVEAADLTFALMDAYRRACESTLGTKGAYAYHVVKFYLWCRRSGYDGYTREVARDLNPMSFESGLRGHIARTQCPRRGAYSFEERVQIERAIRQERGDPQDRAIVAVFFYLGVRTEAVTLMRRRHLEAPIHPGECFWLHVPRVKQRGAGGGEHTDRRRIDPQLGALLLSIQPAGTGDADTPLFPLTPGREHDDVRQALCRWADHDDVDLVTDRVSLAQSGWRNPEKPVKRPELARLHVFPYRFRRTIATIMADQGAEVGEIAAALGDKTLAMAIVYAQSSATMVEVLERTLDRHPEWIRVVNLFRGTVAEGADAQLLAILGGAPQLAAYAEYVGIGVIGFCANEGECTWFPPIACYRCPFFRAVAARLPHRRQLAQLKEEIASGIGVESDRMIAVLERDAAAIVELLARIAERGGSIGRVEDAIAATHITSIYPSAEGPR
jgi:hypothetical protein